MSQKGGGFGTLAIANEINILIRNSFHYLFNQGENTMSSNDKQNLGFFQASTMAELYWVMDAWQKENGQRLQSLNIQPDGGTFSCIALSNPSEVVIVDRTGEPLSVIEYKNSLGHTLGRALITENRLKTNFSWNNVI